MLSKIFSSSFFHISYLLSIFLFLFPSPALAASLSLAPSTGSISAGCVVPIKILINTGGASTSGTDVIVYYNPDKVTAQSIQPGSAYSEYPNNTIDTAKGKISLYGLSDNNAFFTGIGTVATVNFLVSSTSFGQADINFDFDPTNPTKTTDSNVIEKNSLQDILQSVTNGSYTITRGTCSTNAAIVQSSILPSPSTLPTENVLPTRMTTLPNSGTLNITFFGFIVSVVLMGYGSFGLWKGRKL